VQLPSAIKIKADETLRKKSSSPFYDDPESGPWKKHEVSTQKYEAQIDKYCIVMFV